MPSYDLVVIGAGIAGMTSALSAAKEGIKNILIVERESYVGGILNQLIHNGFGKEFLGKEVTGPEYVSIVEEELNKLNIKILLNTKVLDITRDKVITYVNSESGVVDITAGAVILAMGSREKFTGNVMISTNGLTGIFTIGEAQKIINLEGYLPGKKTIIYAKNKWGFIVARRLIIESGNVEAVIVSKKFAEIRTPEIDNIIEGFNIPIIDNSQIIEVEGDSRINKIKILNMETNIVVQKDCDSLLLTVGFVPESFFVKKLKLDINNETLGPLVDNFKTSLDGFFACGNILYGEEAFDMAEINGLKCGIESAKYINKYIY